MNVVFDENMPIKLVEGMQAFTYFYKSKTIVNLTSIHLLDQDSIPDVGVLGVVGENGILISYDKDFKTHKKLKHVIASDKIGVFWVQQPKVKNLFVLATFLLNNWPEIMDKIDNQERPFIYQVLKRGVTKLSL